MSTTTTTVMVWMAMDSRSKSPEIPNNRHGNERRSAFAERRSVFGVLFGFVFLFGERCSVFGVRRSVFRLFGVRCFVRRRFLHVVVFGVQFEKDCALGVLFGVVFQYCVLFGVSFGIACFVQSLTTRGSDGKHLDL